MGFGKTTPILRIFDEAKAREFYVDFLGFRVDWDTVSKRGYRYTCKSQRMTASSIYRSIMETVVPVRR
jgi:catechol 2,3-dioxygenase-like lactoylglutathione lyase family enzyme